MTSGRRRPMRRLGDLLPEAAASLGLEEELRLARAMSAWERIVAEHVPAAAGTSRLIGLRGDALLVTAASGLVASELRMRSSLLLAALALSPGGVRARELSVVVRQPGAGRGDGLDV
jgi:predicted nucleic acid-binding Zn ribbon protein